MTSVICQKLLQGAKSEPMRRPHIQTGKRANKPVTLGKLAFGAENSQQVERNLADIEATAARLEVLRLDTKAAYHFGRIRRFTLGDGP